MNKKIIQTENAPQAIGPYSQAVVYGNTLYISGQVCIVPQTGELLIGSIKEETHQVMKNLLAVIAAADFEIANALKTTIFLSDMAFFAEVNEVYASYFTNNYPARETVAVKTLPKNVRVEISMIVGK